MMIKDGVLIIRYNQDVVSNAIRGRGYSIQTPYRGDSLLIGRLLRKTIEKLFPMLERLFYNDNIKNFNPSTIIVFETLISPNFIKWLHTIHPRSRIIIWYWNYTKNTIHPDRYPREICELWSFSRKDCESYQMLFNPPPYFYELVKQNEGTKYDISFVGKDKGRLRSLLYYKNEFEKLNLVVKFVVTPDRRWKRSAHYSKIIPYSESINISASSKAVFDFIEIPDSGQSMRVMESLFCDRKIITNSILVQDYDFYDKHNIFILGLDKLADLNAFLEMPYHPVDSSIKQQYDFDHFVSRLLSKSVMNVKRK